MTTIHKKQALENALKNLGFKDSFTIKTDEINGKRFAIAEKKVSADITYNEGEKHTWLEPKTNYMTYEECNAYLFGCYDVRKNKNNYF